MLASYRAGLLGVFFLDIEDLRIEFWGMIFDLAGGIYLQYAVVLSCDLFL